jgi:hypothetical protein
LEGTVTKHETSAQAGDLEVWDYKGTKSNSPFVPDYVRQLLTYAALYSEKTGKVPSRCVLFFVNEERRDRKLLAVSVDGPLIARCVDWTIKQVQSLRQTMLQFQQNPRSIQGGALEKQNEPVGHRTDDELRQQCTACGLRFDCDEYRALLGRSNHPDIALTNVAKN